MAKKAKKLTFNLAKDEIDSLRARRNIIGYLQELIRGDMNSLVDSIVKPRLSIKKEINVEVDIDKGILTMDETKEEKKKEKKEVVMVPEEGK